jgi:hypothetical protein
MVRLRCSPADALSLRVGNVWPAHLTAAYGEFLNAAIGYALVDGLLACRWEPYRGCTVTVEETGWDEVMSSEVAGYAATRGAVQRLIADGQWEHVSMYGRSQAP